MSVLARFYNVRLQRELGDVKRVSLDPFINGRLNYCYTFLSKKDNYPIEYYPSILSLKDEFLSETEFSLPVEVFEQFVFSVIKTFQYSVKNNVVNQRLSFFTFHAICGNIGNVRSQLFEHFLFFLQNSESYIENLSLTDIGFCYKEELVDLEKYSNAYFDYLNDKRRDLEDGEDFTVKEINGLRELLNEVINGILNGIKFDADIFSIESFQFKYLNDKVSFFHEMERCLECYYLDSFESSNTKTSLFSSAEMMANSLYTRARKCRKKRKIYSEYFIDSYMLYFLNHSNISVDLTYLKSDAAEYLKKIILYHPLVKNREIKKELSSF